MDGENDMRLHLSERSDFFKFSPSLKFYFYSLVLNTYFPNFPYINFSDLYEVTMLLHDFTWTLEWHHIRCTTVKSRLNILSTLQVDTYELYCMPETVLLMGQKGQADMLQCGYNDVTRIPSHPGPHHVTNIWTGCPYTLFAWLSTRA